jgi:hypothetical protein
MKQLDLVNLEHGPIPSAESSPEINRMTSLTTKQAAEYVERGFLSPVRVFSPEESSDLLRRFNDSERRFGPFEGRRNQKPHLLFPWLHDLVNDKRILDAVETVLGPDLLCYSAQFFGKKANDPAFVSWHQVGESLLMDEKAGANIVSFECQSLGPELPCCLPLVESLDFFPLTWSGSPTMILTSQRTRHTGA